MKNKKTKTKRIDEIWAILLAVNYTNLDDAAKRALIGLAYELSFQERSAQASKR